MANFATINDKNIVTNVIIAENKAIAEEVTGQLCIEYTEENPAGIGFTYDSKSNKFIAPKPPVVEESKA